MKAPPFNSLTEAIILWQKAFGRWRKVPTGNINEIVKRRNQHRYNPGSIICDDVSAAWDQFKKAEVGLTPREPTDTTNEPTEIHLKFHRRRSAEGSINPPENHRRCTDE